MRLVFKIVLINFLAIIFSINIGLATSYYVDSRYGNDSNTGKSHLQAWKTLNKVNSSVTGSGDDVYLRCGSVFNKQVLKVDWPGTAGNRVIIGAYYLKNGVPVVGVNTDGKPTFDGGQSYPAVGTFLGLVTIVAPYITVQDLNLKRSEQYGIRVSSLGDHATIQRNVIASTYWGSISIGGAANYATIKYNKCTDSGRKMLLNLPPWCAAIETHQTTGSVIKYNYVQGSHGEGIGAGDNSIVQFNTVLDCYSVFFYVNNHGNVEMSYNLALGTNNSVYRRGNAFYGRAFDVTTEKHLFNNMNKKNIRIHHNIAINCDSGFRFSSIHNVYYIDYVYVYNNTWIDCRYSLRVDNNGGLTANRHIYYKNNISYPKHASSSHLAIFGTNKNLSNWVSDYNVWAINSAPTDGDIVGKNDSTIDPGFSKKTWRGTINSISNFTTNNLVPTAAALPAGANLGATYQKSIEQGSDFNTLNPDPNIGDPISIRLSSNVWPRGAINKSGSNGCSVCPPKLLLSN